ncbi:MAG: energy transducer TonB [Ignavibacteria bacterium]|nr:energy transducer TonB [Ignavibacteria bacterium]
MFYGINQTTVKSSNSDTKLLLYIYADKLPRLDSNIDLKTYINTNLKWPKLFDGQGTVIVSMLITKYGEVKDIKIEKSLCFSCDEEVVTLFSSMPKWIPGEKDNKLVDLKIYLPIEFILKKNQY